MDEWYDLTEKIGKNAWRQENADADDEYLLKLLRDRRALLENAENKIAVLEDVLTQHEDSNRLRHTLIYASDKAPQQLKDVNALLNRHDVLFRQLTYVETADHKKTSEIIRSFQEGTLQVLTAKRVLDEGVNIPQIEKARVLQWNASGYSVVGGSSAHAAKLVRRIARFTTSSHCHRT